MVRIGSPVGEGTEDCIFCGIVRGEAEASIVYEDDGVVAFMDMRARDAGASVGRAAVPCRGDGRSGRG
jgi:hypothetical protein